MRMLGLRRRAVAKVAKPPPKGSSGSDSPSIVQALATGWDPNPLLSGKSRWGIYEEMRRTDPAIRSLLWLFKLPIRSARWSVEPASEDGIDRLVADAVRDVFRYQDGGAPKGVACRQSLDEQLANDLLMLDFGCHFEELVWGDVGEWRDDEGSVRPIRPLVRYAPRYASSIEQVERDPITGEIVWVEQLVDELVRIPGDKIVHLAWDAEGSDWRGVSLLRACYGPWLLKKSLLVVAALGWDRFAAGVPVVRYPDGGGEAAKRQAEEIGRNYRVHERAYVTLEGPKPSEGGQWDIEILNGSQTVADPTGMLRYLDEQIARAGLQQFSTLGTTETGARAVGDVLIDPFLQALQAVAGYIAARKTETAIRRFVDINFGEQYDVPRVRVSRLQARNIALLTAAIGNLASAGFSFADRGTQNDVRDMLDLRALPEVERLPPEVGVAVAPGREGEGLGLGGPGEPAD